MKRPTFLFHYGVFQPLWQQPGLIQCGPLILPGETAVHVSTSTVEALQQALRNRGLPPEAVLIHYTDPFLIRAAPLSGLEQWRGPRLLVCGDLHHGPSPVETLVAYTQAQFHDAVLLAFNPSLLSEVQGCLSVPVHCFPPGFFRYPQRPRVSNPKLAMVHVGSLGPHHPRRRALVEALMRRKRVPFEHYTTKTAEEAADLYASHAIVLNIPLNQDLNHRFFEVMAAGAPQIVAALPSLLGPLQQFSNRTDLLWANGLEQLEQLALEFLQDPVSCTKPVEPPPELPIETLLRQCFGGNSSYG